MVTEQEMTAILRTIKRELRKQASPWLTESEAASYLKVSPKKIRTMRASLRPRLLGKRWRYHREALDRALQNPWGGI